MAGRLTATLARFDQTELRLCRYLNRTNNRKLVRALFRAVSWLGDGWLWYALLAVLPLIHGADGLAATLHMTVTGAVGVIFYKIIKQHAVRERPYVTHRAHIECACAPLDKYSFPSGHTLHAVSFTLLIAHYFPDWAASLACFAALVAMSRIVLGLHYPTDVAAGAILGGLLAAASLSLPAVAGF